MEKDFIETFDKAVADLTEQLTKFIQDLYLSETGKSATPGENLSGVRKLADHEAREVWKRLVLNYDKEMDISKQAIEWKTAFLIIFPKETGIFEEDKNNEKENFEFLADDRR